MLPNMDSIEIPSVPLPSWADMYSMLSLFDGNSELVTIDGANITQLAPADPHRWLIGFIWPSTVLAGTLYGPFSSFTPDGLTPPAVQRPDFFSAFAYGPMVSYQWNAVSGGSQPVRVFTARYTG